MRRVLVYIEGSKRLKRGFDRFLQPSLDALRAKGLSVRVVMCGGTPIQDFRDAIRTHPNDVVLLLKDAEGPDDGQLVRRLRERLLQYLPASTRLPESHLHLMVQIMESWFLADRPALGRYYGPAFMAGRLPPNPRVERIPKAAVLSALKAATRLTSKREYHKTRHAPDLLEQIDRDRVRQAAPNCQRLFEHLESLVGE